MLFFCKWPDRTALLVDASDERDAVAMATDLAEGVAPARAIALPLRAFVAEVFVADETDDGYEPETLVVAPLPHVEDTLAAFDEAEIDAEPIDADACGAEADGDDGAIYRCQR